MHVYVCKFCEREYGIIREFKTMQALAGHIRMAHKDVDRWKRRKTNERKFLEFLKALTEVKELTYEAIAKHMNTTVKNVKRIHEWGKRKGFDKIIKFVIEGRKVKMNTKVKS